MIIVNRHTVQLAREELELQFKETYLDIQEVLVKFLKRAKTEEEKEKIKGMIKDVGEVYKKYKKNG